MRLINIIAPLMKVVKIIGQPDPACGRADGDGCGIFVGVIVILID